MNAKIVHESRGRMRLQLPMKAMTLEQADLLEAWLLKCAWADEVTVHERTRCVILRYTGDRSAILEDIRRFSWEKAPEEIAVPEHSSRALNREFHEKLVCKTLTKIATMLFLPQPLRIMRCCRHMIPFMRRGFHCLFHRQMKVELLDALSVGISAFRGDFGTADAVMFLLEIGELLEEWTQKRAVEDLARCMSLNVDRVWLHTADGDVLTPIGQITAGDQIVIRMGGVIPLDGVVLEGEVMVNQATLTGESVPVAKRPGGALYAGTVVEEGDCIMEVKKASGEGRYDQIVAMIEDSQQLKSAAESKASNLADKLVPYTFLGSALAFLLTRNAVRAVSVLMVDFSCALKLAMPLAVLSAMREAGREHMTVKGGKFLEAVAAADTIVLDKTGTLTHACPKVAKVIPFGGNDPREMLRVAACLEEHFPHSLANAVVQEALDQGLTHNEFHTKVEYLVAHGIATSVNEKRVLIGSAHFIFEDEHCTIPAQEQEVYDTLPNQYSHLFLAIDGQLAAVICISDPLREEAQAALAALRALGVKQSIMLTGDNERTAAAIAAEAGVDDFRANVRPAGKADFVAQLRKEGHTVIMVGDGVNDSPALSEADVGIAVSDGAAIAREISDITISSESLWELVRLRQISMGLMDRIHANYRFVIGFNGSLIALGVAGLLAPAMSATLHNVSTLCVSMHSMSHLNNGKNGMSQKLETLPEGIPQSVL